MAKQQSQLIFYKKKEGKRVLELIEKKIIRIQRIDNKIMNPIYGDMLRTLKMTQPEEIPPYEQDMLQIAKEDLKQLQQQISDMNKQISTLQSQIPPTKNTQTSNLPQNMQKRDKLIFMRTKLAICLDQYYRIKRFMLIYNNVRLNKIEEQFWQFSGNLREQVKGHLSESQRNYFKDYKAIATQYIEDTGLELTVDLDPPIDPSVQVRFLKDCGEILSDQGQPIKLQKNIILFIKKRLIENFIKDGSAQFISSNSY